MTQQRNQATWRYHNGTKHPNGHLFNPYHFYDPAQRPLMYKFYPDVDAIPLPLDRSPQGVPALQAIARAPGGETTGAELDLGTVSRILYFSAGITKYLERPFGKMAFRAASCTGALYHIELYLVCGDLPGLAAGLYHFNPRDNSLHPLRKGDYRQVLVEATGREPSVAQAPAILLLTDSFERNAYKYQAREYRHAFWDSGTILANTLAITATHNLPTRLVAGFADNEVSRLLDLDSHKELPLALVPIGHTGEPPPAAPPVEPLNLEVQTFTDSVNDYPAITDMHDASKLAEAQAVAAWRGNPPDLSQPAPTGRLVPLEPLADEALPDDTIEEVIERRGSTREYARKALTFEQLSTTLAWATRGVPADFLQPFGSTLNHIYLVINAVEGITPGAYLFRRDERELELLHSGNYRSTAGHLGLDQALAADASVDIFFLAALEPILERFGNRGYRAAQFEAAIEAGRIYLAAYAQQFGATGLTFYDDAVTDFFSPHAQGKSVMFFMTLGHRASGG